MKCEKIEKIMVISLYAELKEKDRAVLAEHLRVCSSCKKRYAHIQKQYLELKHQTGSVPEFDWEKSWHVIKASVLSKTGKKLRRFSLPLWAWKTASVCGVFVLGILLGRLLFFAPQNGYLPNKVQESFPAPILIDYFENIRTALIEYDNLQDEKGKSQILAFEKERLQNLLFQNRMIKARLKGSEYSFLLPLLDDLEIVLFETANFSLQNPEYLGFIQEMIKEKEIFFRLRHVDLEPNRTYVNEESF